MKIVKNKSVYDSYRCSECEQMISILLEIVHIDVDGYVEYVYLCKQCLVKALDMLDKEEVMSKNIIGNFENAKNAIYEHVGFVEDYVVYPLDFQLGMYWFIKEDCESVVYAESIDKLNDFEAGEFYEDEIYKQRFYTKHVYSGKDYTLVFCHPGVDGMKYFRIFENALEADALDMLEKE